MSDPRRLDEWKASALKEITQLEAKEIWDECFKSEALDKKEKSEHRMNHSSIITNLSTI